MFDPAPDRLLMLAELLEMEEQDRLPSETDRGEWEMLFSSAVRETEAAPRAFEPFLPEEGPGSLPPVVADFWREIVEIGPELLTSEEAEQSEVFAVVAAAYRRWRERVEDPEPDEIV